MSTPATHTNHPDQAGLEAIVAHWLPLLGLSSWTFSARYARADELDGRAARVHYVRELEMASVLVLRPEERRDGMRPVEQSVLHELVHVRFWAVDADECDETRRILHEQAIDWTARGLYCARYGLDRVLPC